MKTTIVAYGVGNDERARREVARATDWAGQDRSAAPIWRWEGRSRSGAPLHERPRLLEALFLLRADLADTLWLPNWSVLGNDPWRAALLTALIEQAGAELVVDGEPIDTQRWSSQLRIARGWVAVVAALDPRITQRDWLREPDIGVFQGRSEAGRLAWKLHTDLRLSDCEVARIIEAAGYDRDGGGVYSASGLNRLRNEFDDKWSRELAEATEPCSLELGRPCVATFGADSTDLVDGATTFFACLDGVPADRVVGFAVPEPDASSKDRAARPALAVRLEILAAALRAVKMVFVSDPGALWSDEAERSLVAAYLTQYQAQLVVGDVVTTPEPAALVGQDDAARSLLATYAALRAHDGGSVIDRRSSLAHARAFARQIHEQGEASLLREIAHQLNEEAIPTRRGTGKWSPSAVRKLLKDEK